MSKRKEAPTLPLMADIEPGQFLCAVCAAPAVYEMHRKADNPKLLPYNVKPKPPGPWVKVCQACRDKAPTDGTVTTRPIRRA